MAIGSECTHCVACGSAPIRSSVPAAREPLENRSALDEISEDERWLWRLVDEADRVMSAAPPAPDEQRLSEVEQRYAIVRTAEERVQARIRATERALARPGSWLRPAHRSALVKHLREDRSAAVATAVQRGRVEEVRNRLLSTRTAREAYLAQHHTILSAGRNARTELERIFDDLIDSYARLPEPPAWFRFGLEFPPAPGTQRAWLNQAREAVAQRRRQAIQQPIW
ncbi:hypothetical protein [Catelliglobosispora koreensis]|uniref:hypothetical protein n=1 Tax=Catelliglobosispora koreensis TaxID=129052 RepID=UPI000477FFE3|nr:hypothetical protein [Catelliglobosispora koreensis]